MFIEQRLERLTAAVKKLESQSKDATKVVHRLAERQDSLEDQVQEAIAKVAHTSGVSAADLAKLLAEMAANLYPGPHPTAPKGSIQDDGEPTDKPGTAAEATEPSDEEGVGLAQKAEASPPPPSDAETPVSGGGARSPEVVAPTGEASASPAVDGSFCTVDGRAITGPRAVVMVQEKQAAIIRRLLAGPGTIYDLAIAAGDGADIKGVTNVRMRLANMRVLLSDAGLEIKADRCANGDVYRLASKGARS